MSFKEWVAEKHLRPHKTTREEIKNLLSIVDRDSRDAKIKNLSPDARFVIAYNAALKLCTILLYASGFRTQGPGAHFYTIEAMAVILGEEARADADFMDSCRTRRNHAEYDYVDVVSEDDVDGLILFVQELRTRALGWLKKNYSDLVS